MFENPFRAGGELSKDADDIVDAFKTGKLSVISNGRHMEFEETTSKDIDDNIEDDEKRECLVQPLVRKNGVMAVQKLPVVNIKQEKFDQKVFEDEKKRKKEQCCVLF